MRMRRPLLPWPQAPQQNASQNAPQVENASRRETVLTRNSYCSDLPNPTAERWTVPVDDSVYFQIVDPKNIFHVLTAFASKKNKVIKTLDTVTLHFKMGKPEDYKTGCRDAEDQINLRENLRKKLKRIAAGRRDRHDDHIGLCTVNAWITEMVRGEEKTFGHRVMVMVLRYGTGLTYHIIDSNGLIHQYDWGEDIKTATKKFFQYVTYDPTLELQEFEIPDANFEPSEGALDLVKRLGITVQKPELALCVNLALIYAVELICTSGSLYPDPGRFIRLIFNDVVRRGGTQTLDTVEAFTATEEAEIMLYSRALAFELYRMLYEDIEFHRPPPDRITTVTIRRTKKPNGRSYAPALEREQEVSARGLRASARKRR